MMISLVNMRMWIFVGQIFGLSYNQPKFDLNATWNLNAITLASSYLVGIRPTGLFVNTNNTIYVTDVQRCRIQIWFDINAPPSMTVYGNFSLPYTIFETNLGEIYVFDGGLGQINRLFPDRNQSIFIMDMPVNCFGLFVDINNTLYCVLDQQHRVVTQWLDDNIINLKTIAGTGNPGDNSTMLRLPNGIFVNTKFDLYVADTYNDRIQLFELGRKDGITIAGGHLSYLTITLSRPAGIVLDGDNYLFITDSNNNRIIRQRSTGFYCLLGCFGVGSSSNQLRGPRTIHFDSYGNIFVTDESNHRVQMFTFIPVLDRPISQQSTIANLFTQFPQSSSTSTTNSDKIPHSIAKTMNNLKIIPQILCLIFLYD